MSNALNMIIYYLQYPFVRYALIVGLLIALCSSLLGVTLVLRRFSYIGDGLSHVAFSAMAVAAVAGLANDMALTLPVTIVAAVLMLRGGEKAKIKGDAMIGMVSTAALAMGYLLMNVFSAGPNVAGDVCSTLFGSASILTLTGSKVTLCLVLSVILMVAWGLFYHKIFAITFDEDFARSAGFPVDAFNLAFAVMIAVIIVLAMNLVGSLLMSALVIFPALSAMRIYRDFRSVSVCAAVMSVTGAFFGIMVSILAETPVGATIVMADLIIFLLACAAGRVTR